MSYTSQYYRYNRQDRKRPALLFYDRLWRRYVSLGPVLDFGGGVGLFAALLSRHADVLVYEVSNFARSQVLRNAPRAVVVEDLGSIDDNALGSITALHVFEHMTDTELGLIGESFRRVLRANGKLLCVMPDAAGAAHRLKGASWSALTDSTHVNLKSADAWRRYFEDSWRFRVIHVFADGYYDFPYMSFSARGLFQDALRAARTLVQFAFARPLLRTGDGENVIFILEADG